MKRTQKLEQLYGDPVWIDRLRPEHFYKFILATTGYKKYNYYSSAIKLRPYQMEAGWAIIHSVINHLGREILVEFSRQSGKTEMNSSIVYFLSCMPSFYKPFADSGIRIGAFGPKKDQSDITFERIKERFDDGFAADFLGIDIIRKNAKEMYLSNGSYILCSTASKTATIEGPTLHLAILEEAQDIDDLRMKKSIFPMLAATNGTRVLSGTATPERKGYFHQQLQIAPASRKFIYNYKKTMKYSKKYETFVLKEMKKYGEDSIEFQTQFALNWMFDITHLVTEDMLFDCRDFHIVPREMNQLCYVGIDIGRQQSSTVVTIYNHEGKIINWLELTGDDYETQKEVIVKFLNNYRVGRIVIDSFGPGAPIGHALARKYDVELFEPTTPNNSKLFLDFRKAIRTHEVSGFSYPQESIKERHRFERQMLDMEMKYKGSLLFAHKPKHRNARDDYCTSAAYGWRARTKEDMYLGIGSTIREEE